MFVVEGVTSQLSVPIAMLPHHGGELFSLPLEP